VLLACAVLAVVPRAEASPFLLNLVASDSSDEAHAGGGGEHGARLGLRVRRPELPGPVSIYNGIGLKGLARPTISTLSPWTSSHVAVGLFAAPKSSDRVAGTSVADVGSVTLAGLASLTQLDLGHGAQLSVSDSVGAALADALSSSDGGGVESPSGSGVASRPATPSVANESNASNNADVAGNNHDSQSDPTSGYNPVSPLPGSTADGLADESVKAILTDISSGIISSAGEGAAAGDLAPAENLVQNPEPATLVLLASALALTANRLRRVRH